MSISATIRAHAAAMTVFAIALAAAGAANGADPANGNTLYHTTYGCTACHTANPGRAFASGATVAGLTSAIQSIVPMSGRYALTLAANASDLADIAAYLAQVSGATPATGTAVEYYHAGFDHYFITAIADEIAKLDSGVFAGWARTGLQFNVYLAAATGAATVCRFFSATFAPKSSHFYTPSTAECATVKANPDWQYEGDVFYIAVGGLDGSCPAGSVPVYRLYNGGQGGAPNHRYTVDVAARDQMVARGWTIEGNGPGLAFMCAPG